MADPIFISQEKLERGIERGDVAFADGILTLLSKAISYRLAPAVRITSLLEGEDTQGLIGRVWTVAQLEEMGAESFRDSVIAGDTAYECEEGFVGIERAKPAPPPLPKEITGGQKALAPLPPKPRQAPPPPAAPASPAPTPTPTPTPAAADEGETAEMDLLTDYFLKNM